MKKNLLHTIFSGVGMAMGVATVVMSILGVLAAETAFMLLGLGVFSLGMASLDS